MEEQMNKHNDTDIYYNHKSKNKIPWIWVFIVIPSAFLFYMLVNTVDSGNEESPVQDEESTKHYVEEGKNLICKSEESPSMYDDSYSNNYKKAIANLQIAAHSGNSEAKCLIGCLYYYGNIYHNSNEFAVRWFRKAVKDGNAYAKLMLANCYYNGHGIEESAEKADELADAAFAQYKDIGIRYENGLSDYRHFLYKGKVFHDKGEYRKALLNYHIAAIRGSKEAIFLIGEYYYRGYHVKKSKDTAIMWFKIAEEEGFATTDEIYEKLNNK